MKKYFIKYFSNFCNVYDIVSVESDADKKRLALHQDDDEWERITLKEVKEKIREEKFRRKYDSNFSGYAPIEDEILSMSEFYQRIDFCQMFDEDYEDDYQDETTQLPEKKVKNKLVPNPNKNREKNHTLSK